MNVKTGSMLSDNMNITQNFANSMISGIVIYRDALREFNKELQLNRSITHNHADYPIRLNSSNLSGVSVNHLRMVCNDKYVELTAPMPNFTGGFTTIDIMDKLYNILFFTTAASTTGINTTLMDYSKFILNKEEINFLSYFDYLKRNHIQLANSIKDNLFWYYLITMEISRRADEINSKEKFKAFIEKLNTNHKL